MSAAAALAERSAVVRTVPAGLAASVAGLHIAYPLTPPGGARHWLTIVTVVTFACASVAHAWLVRGAAFAGALVLVTAGGGLAIEAAGVATGVPFGSYRYTGTLGPAVAGVPVLIGPAWTMMAYPAYTVAHRVVEGPVRVRTRTRPAVARTAGTVLLGAWAFTAWDLFLDPQMVAAGHWAWTSGGSALLGIPVSNFAGWYLAALPMMTVLRARDPLTGAAGPAPDDRVPHALYLWTYASSVLAHAVFLGLPGSAVAGGAGMGVVVAAYIAAVRR